jgi:hypothetical protein
VAAGIAAHARFTAAQRLAAEDWGKSVAAVQALADGELQGTFYGRRARAHMQALGEDYRAPLVGTEPGSEVPRKRRK